MAESFPLAILKPAIRVRSGLIDTLDHEKKKVQFDQPSLSGNGSLSPSNQAVGTPNQLSSSRGNRTPGEGNTPKNNAAQTLLRPPSQQPTLTKTPTTQSIRPNSRQPSQPTPPTSQIAENQQVQTPKSQVVEGTSNQGAKKSKFYQESKLKENETLTEIPKLPLEGKAAQQSHLRALTQPDATPHRSEAIPPQTSAKAPAPIQTQSPQIRVIPPAAPGQSQALLSKLLAPL